jgi:hypothetical protein
VMEKNREAVEKIIPPREEEDWLARLRFVPTDEQLKEAGPSVEEIDEPV